MQKGIAIKYSLGLFLFILCNALGQVAWADAKQEVAAAYHTWCSSVQRAKGDVSKVEQLYARDAILLPTLSPKILVNKDGGLDDYFHHFLAHPNLTCKTDQLITRVYGKIAMNIGLYTFSYTDTDGKTVFIPARFTFVYQKQDDEWMIIHQQSSRLPVPVQ